MYSCLRAEHSGPQLARTHFEGKNPHSNSFANRNVLSEVQGERGLSHARASREDHQVRWVESSKLLVQVGVARGASHHLAGVVRSHLDSWPLDVSDFRDRLPIFLVVKLCDLKDAALGEIQQFVCTVNATERSLNDLSSRLKELTASCLV